MHTLMSKTYEILLTHDFCGSNVFVLSLDCYTFYLKVLIWCKIMLSGLNKIIIIILNLKGDKGLWFKLPFLFRF